MLAAAGAGLDHRLSSRRHGLAPSPQLGPGLLEAADRVRTRRSDARAQVAREVQRAGTRAVGRPHVRVRSHPDAALALTAHLPRRLGSRAVPIAVRAGTESGRLPAPDARVAPDDGDAGSDGGAQRGVEPAAPGV